MESGEQALGKVEKREARGFPPEASCSQQLSLGPLGKVADPMWVAEGGRQTSDTEVLLHS